MLSDHERESLRELELQLMNEDPNFPRSFDARAQRLSRQHPGVSGTIAIVAGVLLSVFMLVVGSPGGALAFAAATGLIWLAWKATTRTRQ